MRTLILLSVIIFLLVIIRSITVFYQKSPYKAEETVSINYTFLDEPKTTVFSQEFRVSGIQVKVKRYPEYHYGDSIQLSGKLTSTKSPKTGLLLSYPAVSKVQGIDSYILVPFAWIRSRISSTFNHYLNSVDAGLLLGIVFGIKSGVKGEFYSQLRETGVIHIIAASGMNVTMVASFLFSLFSPLFQRKVSIGIAGVILCLYALLAGLQASIIRATLMALVAFGAQMFGRQSLSLWGLFLVASVMLLWNPFYLFDVGFQLSFLATCGILILKPLLDHLLGYKIILKDDFTTTLSAQIFTLPLLISTFSTYSLTSLFVNLLVLWMIPFLMIFGGIAALISIILPVFSAPFLYLSFPLLFIFRMIVSLFAAFSLKLKIQVTSLFFISSYYFFLMGIIIFLKKRLQKALQSTSS